MNAQRNSSGFLRTRLSTSMDVRVSDGPDIISSVCARNGLDYDESVFKLSRI